VKEEDNRGSLKVRDLVKSYGRRAVVNRVNLAVSRGQIVGLLGPNGAGKTTTFYMIVGLIRAKEGHIFLDGRDITYEPMYIRARQPFAGIDPMAINDIKQIVKGLKERGLGILISDHNVRETLDVSDLAYIINEGEIIESGTPEKIAASEVVRSVYLGEGFYL